MDENFRLRTTVSLPAKAVFAADLIREINPEDNFQDFSDVVGRALLFYAATRHPKLLEKLIADLRSNPVVIEKHKFYNPKNPTGKKRRPKPPQMDLSRLRRSSAKRASAVGPSSRAAQSKGQDAQ